VRQAIPAVPGIIAPMIGSLWKDLAREDEPQAFEWRVDDFARGLPCVVFDPNSIPAKRRTRVPKCIRNEAQPIIGTKQLR
jgi:hypothetical protein